MLLIVEDFQLQVEGAAQGIDRGAQRTVTLPLQRDDLVAAAHLAGKAMQPVGVSGPTDPIIQQAQLGLPMQAIGLAEQLPELRRGLFPAGFVGPQLDDAAEFHLQPTRQPQAVILLQQPGDAALARLAVDPDDRLIAAADIGRVQRQIGHAPEPVAALGLRREALLDRVLMRAGKGGEHQLARVGMTRMHRQLVAGLHQPHHFAHIGEIQPRIDPLGVEIHRQRYQIDVAGAFAIAEQAAFHPLRPGQLGLLGTGHPRAPVVVRMHADGHRLAGPELSAEPFDLVGIDIGHRHLHGRRQVEDQRPLRIGLPGFGHRLANLQGELQFGEAEGFRRILVGPAGLRLLIT